MAKIISTTKSTVEGIDSAIVNKTKARELLKQVTVVNQALQKRFDALGGERFLGPLEKKDGRVWYYQKGCLYYNKAVQEVL